MNSIDILEELKNKQYTNKDILGNLVLSEEEYTAITTLIAENKELKEMLKHRIEYTNKLEKDLFQNASNYVIPKSKIEEKIEEYRNKRNELASGDFWKNANNINQDTALFIAGETLQELLDERNNTDEH